MRKDTYTLLEAKNCPNEFHMFKNGKNIPPGQLQYRLTPEIIQNLDVDGLLRDGLDYYHNSQMINSDDIQIEKCVPNTPKGRAGKWNFLIGTKQEDGAYKVALLDKKTNEIALFTCFNPTYVNYTSRSHESLHPDFRVCSCKMIAPLVFWHILECH